MAKQLAFEFGDNPNPKRSLPQFVRLVSAPPPDAVVTYQQRIEEAKALDVSYPSITVPEDYYQEEEPHLPCERCRFPLQPRLHYVMVTASRFLCLNCFEDEMGLEPFTVDAWLEAQAGDTDWQMAVVEKYVDVK